MKRLSPLYIFSTFNLLLGYQMLFGQPILKNQYPFDREMLETHAGYKDTIMPTFVEGKFYYVSTLSLKKVFKEGFDLAYPFVGKSAVVMKNGKYGVINKKGMFILQPMYQSVKLPSYEDYLVILKFLNSETEIIFNLYQGKKEKSYIDCEKPAVPEMYAFAGENKKYGLTTYNKKVIIEPIYDSVLFVHFDYIVVKQNSKIRIIDKNNHMLIPFEYDDFIYPIKYTYPSIIGLKKNDTWYYYDSPHVNTKPVIESNYKCFNLSGLYNQKALGLCKHNDKYTILFKDGSILPKEYDWISESGIIAMNNGNFYILKDNGSEFIYYPNQK